VKKYFVTGLLIWIPLAITFWVLNLIVTTMDQTLLLLPESVQPRVLIGWHIPGVGLLLSLLVILVTGLLAANIMGQRLLHFGEGMLARIPVVKSIYNSVKQVSDTLLSSSGQALRRPCWSSTRVREAGPSRSRLACPAATSPTISAATTSACTCPPPPTPRPASSSCCPGAMSSSST
jgi:hypothetical protein